MPFYINAFCFSDGPKLKMIIGQDEHKGYTLTGQLSAFTSCRNRLLDGLLKSLSSRFQVDVELMRATSIVKLELWPQLLSDDQGE